jgi:organic hydroperoxide reductase OsmC/OhrA
VVVTAYVDRAEGWMEEDSTGGGRFTRVLLKPHVTIAAGSDPRKGEALHHDAHAMCFIANSVNFPIACEPTVKVGV